MLRALRCLPVCVALGLAGSAACAGPRAGELEPRYVAVHNTLAALGMVQTGPIQQGSLAEGRETRLRVELAAQCTTLVAMGGPGVRDLDVALLDPDDKPVAHDTTQEPQATLRACPTAPGHYTLVVRMRAGAGDFVTATWTGGASAGPTPDRGAALAEAGAGTCALPMALAPGASTGTTRHGDAENAGSCASSDAKELVYKLEVTRRQRVTVEVDPQFDSVVYMRKDDCGDSDAEVACNDDATSGAGKRGPSSHGSRLDEVLEPGTYYVFVDGYGSEAGTFRMNVGIADVPSLADACRHVPALASAQVTGSLAGAFDHGHASCGGEAKGPESIHRLDVPARARVRITERSGDFTPVVHLRRQCADDHSEVACADGGARADEATWAGVLDPGSYVLFADSSDADARGTYTLEAELASDPGPGARGDACGDAVPLGPFERAVEGDTFSARDDVRGTCSGAGAADVVYRFELARRSRVTARFADQEGSHVFVVTQSCTDRAGEVACGGFVDDVLEAGVYYLAVDGKAADSLGRFTFAFAARDVSGQESACRTPPALATGATVTGTTTGGGDRFHVSCAGREDLQSSPDRVYRITLGMRSRVELALATPTWDGVLAVRTSCLELGRKAQGTRALEAACNNDAGDTRHAKIDTTLEAGTYFVVVDGHASGNEGAFTLQYRATPAAR
ncbi:MAG: hypothetical protein JWP97_254 [Labilithrix sp.]|nr:hypothetical protein [Labilithrix sp.]